MHRLHAEAAAGHDLAIALKREPPPGQSESIEELRETKGGLELLLFSIDGNRDHC